MPGWWWYGLPAAAQDGLIAAALLSPLALTAAALLPGHRPWPLVRALIWRHRAVSAGFSVLIAASVALGTGLLAQERAVRSATAQAADPFDVIVAAPGSELTALLATVFLQPSDVGLIGGALIGELAADDRVVLAAPLAFGDSVGAVPVVGTTAQLVEHLGGLSEGRIWAGAFEAIAGSAIKASVGDKLDPAHGVGDAADEHAHEGAGFAVVGRLAPTGTPWDHALVVPVEAVWQIHGLADGHSRRGGLGPPFEPDLVPGVPAIAVVASSLGGAYSLQSAYTRRGETMAFFPGAVLARLHGVMGDVRDAMSVMAIASQVLVAASVLCGLAIVVRLFRRQLALLVALGASKRFLIAVVWLYSTAHLLAGAALGLVLGFGAAEVLSSIVSRRTGLEIAVQPGIAEALTVAGFLGLTTTVALLTALAAPTGNAASDLR